MFNHVKDQYITMSTLLILGSWLLSSWEIHEQFNNESSLTWHPSILRDKILLNNYHSERSRDGRKEFRTARLHGQGESSGAKNIIPEKNMEYLRFSNYLHFCESDGYLLHSKEQIILFG